MADRRQASSSGAAAVTVNPAALVYEDTCHLLAISPRWDCRAVLSIQTTGPSPPSSFVTNSLSFPDGHAVALACALLARHGAAPRLVRRFLDECSAIIPHVAHTNAARSHRPFVSVPPAHPHAPAKRARATPWFSVDFSANANLSSRGAGAVLAACLLIPGPAFVELDLHDSSEVTALTLRPWLAFLATERNKRLDRMPCAVVCGLRLDGCPLRSIDLDTLRVLADLKWISLRYTVITNLWRCADILHALPGLVAALFQGTTSATLDEEQLNEVRNVCRKTLLCHSSDAASDTSCNPPNDPDSLHQRVPELTVSDLADASGDLRKQPTAMSSPDFARFIGNTVNQLRLTASLSGDNPENATVNRNVFIRNMAEVAYCFRRTVPAPVTMAPRFFEFLLANTTDTLKILDGVKVSPRHRKVAANHVDKHFEELRAPDEHPQRFSIMSLIRHREEGFSRSPHRSWKSGRTTAEHHQRKRRRSTEYSPRKTDLMAAVAAAGLPALKRPGRLSPATSMTVALAAASSVSETANDRMGTAMEKVQEAALGASTDPKERAVSPLGSPALSECNYDRRTLRIMSHSGLRTFSEGEFELSLSSTLIRRPGAPRIQYLSQGDDRPRQFEYNPAIPSELVYGTEDGYLVVIDQETGDVKGSCLSGGGRGNRPTGQVIPQTSKLSSISNFRRGSELWGSRRGSAPVFGLSWLNKRNDLFLSGTNDGAIHVYNVNWMSSEDRRGCMYACETFQQLTSLHVSCDDVRFAVSGGQPHVGLFDLETGQRTELMRGCHKETINVIKFAHRSPHVLVTSSFDQCVKKWDLRESRPGGGRRPIFETRSRTDNVMACFSPDDTRLLVSAVDNEVTQYSACDGRLEREFNIPKTGSSHNYTRSYYMNDRDYIITGSCMENVVRVYNARTGAFFTEVDMDNREMKGGRRLLVQSLRANPGRRFNFSALLYSKVGDTIMHGLIANADLHRR